MHTATAPGAAPSPLLCSAAAVEDHTVDRLITHGGLTTAMPACCLLLKPQAMSVLNSSPACRPPATPFTLPCQLLQTEAPKQERELHLHAFSPRALGSHGQAAYSPHAGWLAAAVAAARHLLAHASAAVAWCFTHVLFQVYQTYRCESVVGMLCLCK